MLILISLAMAADREVGVALTTLARTGDFGQQLGFGAQNPMAEIYGAIPVHPNVAITGAVFHGSTAQFIGSEEDTFSGNIQTRTWSTGVKLGAKLSLDVSPWWAPYLSAQGVGLDSYLRLDDDAGVDDNATQVEANGITGGVAAGLGSTFRIKLTDKVKLGLSGEFAYTWLAPMDIGGVALVGLDGVGGRLGASVIF